MKQLPAILFLGAALLGGAVPMSVSAAPVAEPRELPASVIRAFDTYTALPAELLPVLQSVQDKASADAAAPKLHAQLDHIFQAREALQGIRELTSAESAAVQQRYAGEMRRRWGQVYDEIFRLRKAQCYGSIAFVKEFGYMTMMLAQ